MDINPVHSRQYDAAVNEFKHEMNHLSSEDKKVLSHLLSGSPSTDFQEIPNEKVGKILKNLTPLDLKNLERINPNVAALASGILKHSGELT